MRKKILIIIVGITLVLQLVTIVKATEFHIIKGTLYIDGEVAGPGIDIELEVIGDTFTIETFEQNEDGFNFYSSGFEDATYGGETVYFTVIYNGNSYTPIYNASIELDKDDEDVEVYILDLNIDTSENNPPNTPSNPSPGNGATEININADLSWSGGDPDDDTVTYDIYFGTSSSPPLVKSGHISTSYDVGTLNYYSTYYWQIVAEDEHGLTASGSIWSFTTEHGFNNPPETPIINGPTTGKPGQVYSYVFVSEDTDGHDVFYEILWGDGTFEEWIGPYYSGELVIINHSWSSQGTFIIKAKAKDVCNATSDWATLEVTMPRDKATTISLFLRVLERFPLLERFLDIWRWNIE